MPLLLLLLACKDDTAVDDSVPTDDSATPTFADVEIMLGRSCVTYGCHAGPETQTGLNLSPGVAYNALVNVGSVQLPSMALVAPGDADRSYLQHKLEGTHEEVGGSGDRMPPDLPFGLDPGEIARVRAWIDAGALP